MIHRLLVTAILGGITALTANCKDIYRVERVRPVGASSVQVSAVEKYGAMALIDGDYQTYYHSPWRMEKWSGGAGTVFPIEIEFAFDGTRRVTQMSLMHRGVSDSKTGEFTPGTQKRGQVGRFRVYGRSEGESAYTLVGDFDLGYRGGYQTVNFALPVNRAASIKIEILDGDPFHEADKPNIAIAEVEFSDSGMYDVTAGADRLFTDASCSELKPGLTWDDVSGAIPSLPYLALNVAMPLLMGTYPEKEKEFRIHSYEAYSNNRLAKDLVTQPYSMLDNPTGIEVREGETLLIGVDDVPPGQTVAVAVYGDDPSGNHPNFGGKSLNYEGADQWICLQKGINQVHVTASGMLYVMNTARALSAGSRPVKVHVFPGFGKVQGYYDYRRHTDDDFARMVDACTYKYFTVKGEKCIFLFHKEMIRLAKLRAISGSLSVWDDIVKSQHRLMGLDRHPEFNNHMLVMTGKIKTDAFMDASHRRIRVGPLLHFASREAMLLEAAAISHELGHINQEAISWRSTNESSNELFVNVYMNPVRNSDGRPLSFLAQSYASGKAWPRLGNDKAYQGEDNALHMRMNWQLWCYFYECGLKPDFFPSLFEYFRGGHQLPNQIGSWYGRTEDPGLAQLEYYEACCKVSGLDLTDFFDAWGFFRPVDYDYKQYVTVRYKVTEEMIAASKSRVAAMNLPKAPPIQYLEDRESSVQRRYSNMGNISLFKTKAKIDQPVTATISGRKVTVSSYSNVVAIELRRGTAPDGELLYFSNLSEFTSPVDLSLVSLWAVQSDGVRKNVQITQ